LKKEVGDSEIIFIFVDTVKVIINNSPRRDNKLFLKNVANEIPLSDHCTAE